MNQGYPEFFEHVTGHAPYPYQVRLGQEGWSELMDVPTGLGKTAAVVVAWLWNRLHEDPGTPRRLVYCLPMRVLVEQTVDNARDWLSEAEAAFTERDLTPPTAFVVMGGDVETGWVDRPAQPAVIVGTQDMLLSRALMRGYGMSRYQWPIHFGLLHNDALWVFDEVQLMGPGLTTSAQLEAFRRSHAMGRPGRSVWMSATLDRGWLDTVDFRPHLENTTTLTLGDDDRKAARTRLAAGKRLHAASVQLDQEGAKKGAEAYIEALAGAVVEAHRPGTRTLVIVNRVARAQALYRALAADDHAPPTLLLHARFRPAERRSIERTLRDAPDGAEGIVVATQAIEAGLDISSATLFTELAPWPSLVQRFGRCNRRGEVVGGADIHWIDILDDADEALPYDDGALTAARNILETLDSAGIGDLPPVESPRPVDLVLRRKDFTELFDTEPDLSGFDVDVSPYIRDRGTPQVQVFWRAFDDEPGEEPPPQRVELCSVSMGQIGAYLKRPVKGRTLRYWTWDGLAERWQRSDARETPRPGATLMLRAGDGGYTRDLGFVAVAKDPVEPLPAPDTAENAGMRGDHETTIGRFITLEEHTANVRGELRALLEALPRSQHAADNLADLPDDEVATLLDTAALWHDVGKAHPAFQTALLDFSDDDDGVDRARIWAKSSGKGRLRYRIETDDGTEERRYFRHELASMLAWVEHGPGGSRHDLVAYLIACHHGKMRLALRALPDEKAAPDGREFARGVWDGDALPAIELDGLSLPVTTLRLDLMKLGLGEQGPSWTERTRTLLERHGPFRLGWLEMLLRVADQRASAGEKEDTA